MKAVIDAIKNMLTGDSTYVSLLGSPSVEPYKTYYLDPPVEPDFPFVVFEFRPVVYDTSVGREFRAGRGELSITAWAQGKTEVPKVESIMDRIIVLLHQQGSSEGFRCILSREPQALRDHEIDAWGLTAAFEVPVRRSTL